MADAPGYPGTPGWAKLFAGILTAFARIFVILHLTDARGRHGPGRHLPSSPDAPAGTQEHRLSPGGHQPPFWNR